MRRREKVETMIPQHMKVYATLLEYIEGRYRADFPVKRASFYQNKTIFGQIKRHIFHYLSMDFGKYGFKTCMDLLFRDFEVLILGEFNSASKVKILYRCATYLARYFNHGLDDVECPELYDQDKSSPYSSASNRGNIWDHYRAIQKITQRQIDIIAWLNNKRQKAQQEKKCESGLKN